MINKTRTPKKKEVIKRIDQLDPNNKGNAAAEKKLIKKRGKKVPDDGFEHRTSKETSL